MTDDAHDKESLIDQARRKGGRLAAKPKTMAPTALCAWRHRHGYTQQQASLALGLSLTGYKQYEGDKRPIPRTIELLCAAYDAGFRIDGAGDPPLRVTSRAVTVSR